MLTFLRKIRKSLFESSPAEAFAKAGGSARKYLIYAIGEIALVVIGILIALQINNWNTERKNTILRQVYLESLINQLEQNIKYTDDHIIECDNRIATFDRVFEELNSAKINYDSLAFALDNTFDVIGTSNFQILAFEELISSNNILLFEKDLRDKILGYYSHINWVTKTMDTFLNEIREYKLNYWESIDMAYYAGFKEKENKSVDNWRLHIDSPQFLQATNFFTFRKQFFEWAKLRYGTVNKWAQYLKSELEERAEKQ